MTEKYLQVPTSLIKHIHTALGFHAGYDDDLTRLVDALLSQPEPTDPTKLILDASALQLDAEERSESRNEP